MQRPDGENYIRVKRLVEDNRLNTICTSGNCPNIGECWNAGTATFMILGNICTRSCKFCATLTGKPMPPDPEEPLRLARSISKLKLGHCVITSVDRDDLDDGGSSQWADTIRAIKDLCPGVTIEALIPDFGGDRESLMKVLDAGADVVAHNLETVRRLTPLIRSRAEYDLSLSVVEIISLSGVRSKSGIMTGLGETDSEVFETMADLRNAGCEIITIGQYLQPSFDHIEPAGYTAPEKFAGYRDAATELGFAHVESGPLVRSSYHAERHVPKSSNKNEILLK